jgi:peroxiredoxin/glutaredoxin
VPTTTPRPITILGRPTCEDTAIVRDRLGRLDVPFTEVDVDRDTAAGQLCESLNDGNRVTPTILFGGTDAPIAEPSLTALDARLEAEGWPAVRPQLVQFEGDLIARPLPAIGLVGFDGQPVRLSQFRGRRQLAVFFAHAADCRTCSGYARQLAAVNDRLAEGDARALVIVPGDASVAGHWRETSTDKLIILADSDGRWRTAVAAHLAAALPGAAPTAAMLLGLDRFIAPRVGSVAGDAGGLVDPLQAAAWLVSASFECAECATPVGWGDEPAD